LPKADSSIQVAIPESHSLECFCGMATCILLPTAASLAVWLSGSTLVMIKLLHTEPG